MLANLESNVRPTNGSLPMSQQMDIQTKLSTVLMPLIQSISPDSGGYLSEVSPGSVLHHKLYMIAGAELGLADSAIRRPILSTLTGSGIFTA